MKSKVDKSKDKMWKVLTTPAETARQKEWRLVSSIFRAMRAPTGNTGPR